MALPRAMPTRSVMQPSCDELSIEVVYFVLHKPSRKSLSAEVVRLALAVEEMHLHELVPPDGKPRHAVADRHAALLRRHHLVAARDDLGIDQDFEAEEFFRVHG